MQKRPVPQIELTPLGACRSLERIGSIWGEPYAFYCGHRYAALAGKNGVAKFGNKHGWPNPDLIEVW